MILYAMLAAIGTMISGIAAGVALLVFNNLVVSLVFAGFMIFFGFTMQQCRKKSNLALKVEGGNQRV